MQADKVAVSILRWWVQEILNIWCESISRICLIITGFNLIRENFWILSEHCWNLFKEFMFMFLCEAFVVKAYKKGPFLQTHLILKVSFVRVFVHSIQTSKRAVVPKVRPSQFFAWEDKKRTAIFGPNLHWKTHGKRPRISHLFIKRIRDNLFLLNCLKQRRRALLVCLDMNFAW